MHGVEIWYHPNDNSYWRVAAGFRYKIVDRGGYTAAQIRAELLNSGATDRTPGAPAQVLGLQAMRAMEGMTVVGATA